ncbi:DUF488 domain-containing protein [Pseudovibrio sp. Tun.PSC04-5.I4]|uniref:DUF488 domain-containing protein n=1 Tax=Pseudovibrio sp. Tun.PSC04-5.I4 TaxID=1798213 RepID=UPI0008879395|nr:DUF488 domain-containing protein [Pseudovibrio sp. Tun.PSC04-5.I4]SDR47496.1 Protein of unknown function, DUF488 [Pseudovibrio sp. Tun.PSC04-5.I4]
MPLSTIGFTKTTAENFFGRLQSAGVKKVIDVRLNNTSQLAGFAKSNDLAFFLEAIGGMGYVHQPLLAPDPDMFKAFKKEKGDWTIFKDQFMGLMSERKIESKFNADMFEEACLLCSENLPHECHRSLVADYLNSRWGGVLKVKHL